MSLVKKIMTSHKAVLANIVVVVALYIHMYYFNFYMFQRTQQATADSKSRTISFDPFTKGIFIGIVDTTGQLLGSVILKKFNPFKAGPVICTVIAVLLAVKMIDTVAT